MAINVTAVLNLTDDNCFDADGPEPAGLSWNEDHIWITYYSGAGQTFFEIQELSIDDTRDLVYEVGGTTIDVNGDAADLDCSAGCTVSGTHGGVPFGFTFTVTGGVGSLSGGGGGGGGGAAEIAISSSEGGSVADGGTDSWASTPTAGAAGTVTYTISNTGTDTLTLDTPTVADDISSASNVTVNSLTLGATSVAAGGSTTLIVSYTPALAGSFGWALSLENDDTDEDPYNITASGTASGAPEIAISSSEGGSVADGGTDSWGSIPAAGAAGTVTYTISNTGTDTLTLDTPTVADDISSASNVTVNSLTLGATSVAAGGSTTLAVSYTPALAGSFGWALSLENDDADEDPYNITASGSASGAAEIAISSSEGGSVADGGTDSWGSIPEAGTASTVTYTISNTGTDTLTLDTPTVADDISSASNVTVNSLTLGSTSVAAGGSTTLIVSYTPALAGSFGWALSLENDDADEDPYNITASGSASGAAEIAISSSEGGSVADGGTDSWGSIPAAGAAGTVTYTISNTGTDTLTLDTPTVAGDISGQSNVTVNSLTLGSTSVAAGGSTTLTVSYTPALAGSFGWALSLENDDADEDPYNITASGTASGAAEIAISSSEGGSVADGGTDSWGSIPAAGAAGTVTYTISNTGTDTLTLDTPTVAGDISGQSNVTVNTLTLGSTSVAAGGSTTLAVSYTPALAGSFGWALSLENDDTDEDPYNITASGSASGAPEIAISSSEGSSVADGGTDSWGSIPEAGTASTVTYTISNTGTDTLTLDTPTVAGNVSGQSNVTVNSLTLGSTSVAAGGSTTLAVSYTPAADGSFGWALSLENDDADEDPYNITASGSASGAAEIAISSSEGGSVADGGTDSWGSIPEAGTASTVTYTISNTGTDTLTLDTPTVAGNISGQSNVTVNSLTLGSTSVAAGGSTTLTVSYTPALAGSFGWALSLENDDADEDPYNITASGSASGAAEIAISSSEGGSVADGGTDSWGSIPEAGTASTVTYTISNTGTDTLTLDTPTVAGNISGQSNVTVNSLTLGATSVAAGGSTTLAVSYTPAADGSFAFTLTLGNNDADENPYGIAASGTAAGVPAALTVVSGSGQAADTGSAFASPLVASVTDENGHGVSGVSVTFTAPASGASLIFAGSGSGSETVTTNASGIAESSAMTANGTASAFAGGALQPYAVTASAAGLPDAAFQLTNNRDSEADILRTREVIASFVANRADRIVAAQPDLTGRLRDAGTLRRSGSNSFAFQSTPGRKSVSFDLSYRAAEHFLQSFANGAGRITPDRADRAAGGSLTLPAVFGQDPASGAAADTPGMSVSFSAAGADRVQTPVPESPFDFWLQGAYAELDNGNGTSGNGFFFAGADYRISENALIGFMGQIDITEEDNPAENTSAEGTGWMAGPYAVVRLQDNLYFDGRAVFGRSYNEVNALGLFTDDFDTSRMLLQAGLTGSFDSGPYTVSPFARVTYFREKQSAYTDALGNPIPSQTFDLGRLEFGPEVIYRTQTAGGSQLALNIALSGIWDFDQMLETPATNTGLLSSSDSFRARVRTGLTYREPRRNILFKGELFYDGIGVSGFEAAGGSLSLQIPL